MKGLIGVVLAAILFGLFTLLRARDRGCTGNCPGCTHDRSCQIDGVKR